jgi:hypothetical protein
VGLSKPIVLSALLSGMGQRPARNRTFFHDHLSAGFANVHRPNVLQAKCIAVDKKEEVKVRFRFVLHHSLAKVLLLAADF